MVRRHKFRAAPRAERPRWHCEVEGFFERVPTSAALPAIHMRFLFAAAAHYRHECRRTTRFSERRAAVHFALLLQFGVHDYSRRR